MDTSTRLTDLPSDLPRNLADLVQRLEPEALLQLLERLAGGPVALLDVDGTPVAGEPGEGWLRVTLMVQDEPLGELAAAVSGEDALTDAVGLAQLVLAQAQGVLMMSDLHLQYTEQNYRALEQRHEALQESERRYRELSVSLERRVAEQVEALSKAEERLQDSRRLAAVGQLAAGIAHEVNNPLAFIQGNLGSGRHYLQQFEVFRDGLRAEGEAGVLPRLWAENKLDYALEDLSSLIEECEEGVRRIATIIGGMKTMTDAGHVSAESAALANITALAVDNMRAETGWTGEVEIAIADDLRVDVRKNLLVQALGNVLINAAQSMPESGGLIRIGADVEADGRLLWHCEDNGEGMPLTTLERAFEPFFTTREVGAGVGLGLTVTREIIMAHGGEVRLLSEQGRGTTVHILLAAAGG
ncbi:MAG: ATP-binding protein [Aquisalimonadaceae bacterium]